MSAGQAVTPVPQQPAAERPLAKHPALAAEYAPGPIRASADAAHDAYLRFVTDHPEYMKLSPDEVVQAMSTYHTEEEHEERERIYGEGVPRYWRRSDFDIDGEPLVENVEGTW